MTDEATTLIIKDEDGKIRHDDAPKTRIKNKTKKLPDWLIYVKEQCGEHKLSEMSKLLESDINFHTLKARISR